MFTALIFYCWSQTVDNIQFFWIQNILHDELKKKCKKFTYFHEKFTHWSHFNLTHILNHEHKFFKQKNPFSNQFAWVEWIIILCVNAWRTRKKIIQNLYSWMIKWVKPLNKENKLWKKQNKQIITEDTQNKAVLERQFFFCHFYKFTIALKSSYKIKKIKISYRHHTIKNCSRKNITSRQAL